MRDKATTRHANKVSAKAAARAKDDRDGDTFLALPSVVIESPGYRRASHEARSLLNDMALPIRRRGRDGGLPNGGLMLDRARFADLGWKSVSTIQRATADLIACGLIVVTRQGGKHRPTLYAVTWAGLAVGADYALDIDPAKWNSVHRGAYMRPTKPAAAPQVARTAAASAARKASARDPKKEFTGPSDGHQGGSIGPSDGHQHSAIGPSDGLIKGGSAGRIRPLDGHSLELCHLAAPSSTAQACRMVRVMDGRLATRRVLHLRRPVASYVRVRDDLEATRRHRLTPPWVHAA